MSVCKNEEQELAVRLNLTLNLIGSEVLRESLEIINIIALAMSCRGRDFRALSSIEEFEIKSPVEAFDLSYDVFSHYVLSLLAFFGFSLSLFSLCT